MKSCWPTKRSNAKAGTRNGHHGRKDARRTNDGGSLLPPLLGVERLDESRWDYEAAGRRQPLPVGEVGTVSPTGQLTPVPPNPQ
jgi:hypothetical protein